MRKKEEITSISLLSRKVRIDGEISGDEHFKIEGSLKGLVNVAGDILVEETGTVDADLDGNNIIIKGLVNGNISAKNRIEIYATGSVNGDISAQSVNIQEGARFEGRSHMVKKNRIDTQSPEDLKSE